MVTNDTLKQTKQKNLQLWTPSKEQISLDWIDLPNDKRNMFFEQGEIIKCIFGENVGYEICNSRPSLVISDTRYNGYGQLVVIPLTKNTRPLKTHYILKKNKYNFLTYDSCVKTEQVKSVSSIRLEHKLGKIDKCDLERIKIRLKTLFNI